MTRDSSGAARWRGDWREAIGHYERAFLQNPSYAPFVLQHLREAYQRARARSAWVSWMRTAYRGHDGEPLLIALVEALCEQGEYEEARALLEPVLAQEEVSIDIPRLYLDVVKAMGSDGDVVPAIDRVGEALSRIGDRRAYQCGRCGFESKSMLWPTRYSTPSGRRKLADGSQCRRSSGRM